MIRRYGGDITPDKVLSVIENGFLGAGAGLGIPGIVVGNQPPPQIYYPPQVNYTPYILMGFGLVAILLVAR